MPKITAFSSSGTGKTTLLTHLAYYAAVEGISTALIELDSRNSLRRCCGLEETNFTTSSLLDREFSGNYNLSPLWESHLRGKAQVCQASYSELVATEKTLAKRDFGSLKLKKVLEKYPLPHDLILLDPPGQEGIMSNSAILASDYLILSVESTSKALDDARNFALTLLEYEEDYGVKTPQILGILVGKYDHNHSATTREIMASLPRIADQIGTILFNPIRNTGEFKNAWSLGMPLPLYRSGHKAAKDFILDGNYFNGLADNRLKDWDLKYYRNLPAIAKTIINLCNDG